MNRIDRDSNERNSTIITDELLRGFIDGRLDGREAERVAFLIEGSAQLQARLNRLSPSMMIDRMKRKKDTPNSVSNTQSSHCDSSLIGVPASVSSVDKPSEEESKSTTTKPLKELLAAQGYEIQKELGRGGMGVVYLAKNVSMDRLEVLKVLNDKLLVKAEARERFQREVRSAAKLSHPSIVTSYSVRPVSNHLVFAMEYVQGYDMHKFISKHNPVPIKVACAFISRISIGLQHAYDKGLVHRDIKPSNIMVYKNDGQLQTKILDFGLARFTSEKQSDGLTQQGQMLGTLEYIAPEQMMNASKADIRADIYSLGCTFYHLLAGKPPFSGTQGELMMAHAQRDPTPIAVVRPDVPAELSTILGKMMAKEADNRFQEPKQIVDSIQGFLALNQSAVTDTRSQDWISDPSSDVRSNKPQFLANESEAEHVIDKQFISNCLANSPNSQKRHSRQNQRIPLSLKLIGSIASCALILPIALFSQRPDNSVNKASSDVLESQGTKAPDTKTIVEHPSSIRENPLEIPPPSQFDIFKSGRDWAMTGDSADFQVNEVAGSFTTWGKKKKDNARGTISRSFVLPQNATQLQFVIRGGRSNESLYVALISDAVEHYRATGRRTNNPTSVIWDVRKLRGKNVTLKLVDQQTSSRYGWNFITAGKFELR